MTVRFLAVVLVSFLALGSRQVCQASTYLYRKSWNAFDGMTSLVAAMEFEQEVTFVEMLGLGSCVSSVVCPLAGFAVLGDSRGLLRLISYLGDVVLQVEPPGDCREGCAIEAASVLHTRPARDCPFDVLVLAYFSGLGLYGMPMAYRTMQGKGWTRLWDQSMLQGTMVQLQVVQGNFNKKGTGVGFTLVGVTSGGKLYAEKGMFMCSDVFLGALRHGLGMNNNTSIERTNVRGIHASRRLGIRFIDSSGLIHHLKWKENEEKSTVLEKCSRVDTFEDEELSIVHATFDESHDDLFVTAILDTGRISRIQIHKNKCKEVHQVNSNLEPWQTSCLGLTSSGGYSLISSDAHATHRQRVLTLYNHSTEFLHHKSTLWEFENFVSFSVAEETLLKSTGVQSAVSEASRAIHKFLTRLASPFSRSSPCIVARMRMWKLRKLQGRNTLILLLPGRKLMLLYRPLFQTNQRRATGGRNREIVQVMTGILKSITLIAAAVIGFRWAGAKKTDVPRYDPSGGSFSGASRARKSHQTPRTERLRKIKEEEEFSAWGLRQESIDRAPACSFKEGETENPLHLL